MKNIFKILAISIAIVVGYFIVLQLYPKNAGRYPFLIALLASDYYLWITIKNWVNSRKPLLKYLLGFLYWSPFIFLIGSTVAMYFSPTDDWNHLFKLYLFGFIFMAYASKVLPIIFLLLADLFRVFQFVNKKAHKVSVSNKNQEGGNKITRSQFLRKTGLISGGLMFSTLLLGMLKWVFDFKIHHHKIRLPHLPISFNNLKIIQISDIHLGSWATKASLLEAVDRINELKPDLIFFTGDLVNYKTDEAFPFENILSRLKAEKGIFATLGNHDYGDYMRWPSAEAKEQNMTDLFDLYKRIGWKLMNNENQVFENSDGKIAVIGVENWGDFGRFPKYGDMEKALPGTEDAAVKLLLSHDPSHWEKIIIEEYPDIDITFAGHTHGFQFGIEIKNIKWSPAQYIYKHWAGMYFNPQPKLREQRLYVNRGLGTIGYPGRVGILPEITLIELQTG